MSKNMPLSPGMTSCVAQDGPEAGTGLLVGGTWSPEGWLLVPGGLGVVLAFW